jgi:hypothetical protein
MRELFTKDLGWKIYSLTLAAAIWMVARPTRHEPLAPVNPLAAWETRTFTNLPVSVTFSSAADVRECKVRPGVVQITVSGRPESLSAVAPGELEGNVMRDPRAR